MSGASCQGTNSHGSINLKSDRHDTLIVRVFPAHNDDHQQEEEEAQPDGDDPGHESGVFGAIRPWKENRTVPFVKYYFFLRHYEDIGTFSVSRVLEGLLRATPSSLTSQA